VIIIFTISYFLGLLWYIFSRNLTIDFLEEGASTFYTDFGLEYVDDIEAMLSVVYFAFTTLSTVGFGDFHPRADVERIVMSFILITGVAMFSFIMGNFIEIVKTYKIVTAENDDSEELNKWLGMIARFNNGTPLPKDHLHGIENYFEYFWSKDKNYAMKTEMGVRFMSELPKNIRQKIYKDFLFKDFLYQFKHYFKFPKEFDNPNDMMTFQDTKYAGFMMVVLKALEPRKF
jgi:hypothetical protein